MLRQLLAAAFCFVAGYTVGATFGFKAAVVDYIENDAQKLDEMADSVYADRYDESNDGFSEELQQKLEEGYKDQNDSEEHDPSDGGSKGYQ
jgi:hypothetical protein